MGDDKASGDDNEAASGDDEKNEDENINKKT